LKSCRFYRWTPFTGRGKNTSPFGIAGVKKRERERRGKDFLSLHGREKGGTKNIGRGETGGLLTGESAIDGEDEEKKISGWRFSNDRGGVVVAIFRKGTREGLN